MPGDHIPIVWSIAIVGAAVVAALPPLVKKFAKMSYPWWAVVVTSAVLAAFWMLFVAPTIVAFGSILITGRTM
ncbi:MAG: hypothetical protein FJY92_02040 [Candidatus Hydrogenedentes bacterium]|nr:hypothetical protein [Candidatus Hydrogenedentota bacterium]